MAEPYLSLVIPTRNDNYPSNVLPVQNKCLSILQRQLEQVGLESEIIVVEYNSDPSNPHLSESLRVDGGRNVTIRVITVGPEYHRQFPHWQKRVFHQTCAVNVGLRRARGRFFVYRAADHIYSDALIRFLGKKTLLDDCIYRCDRFDINNVCLNALDPGRVEEISAVCERHVVDWHKPLDVPDSFHIPKLHCNACGDFLLMSRRVWLKVGGLREGRYPIFLDYDSLVLHASHALGSTEAILPASCRVYKVNHGMKTVARIQQEWSPRWKKFEQRIARTGNYTLLNWSRMLFNYPRRRDKTFDGFLLDSYERHFLLPAQLWAHRFPLVRQNYGDWGLATENLPEHLLACASWERHSTPEIARCATPA